MAFGYDQPIHRPGELNDGWRLVNLSLIRQSGAAAAVVGIWFFPLPSCERGKLARSLGKPGFAMVTQDPGDFSCLVSEQASVAGFQAFRWSGFLCFAWCGKCKKASRKAKERYNLDP